MKTLFRITRATALCLALIFTALSLFSCAGTGKTLLSLDGKTLSVNVYQLYLSRMKANLATYGVDVDSRDFWHTVIDETGKTWNDYYKDAVLDEAKGSLAILCEFDRLEKAGKISYTSADKKALDKRIEEIRTSDFGGSKDKMNAALAAYGANENVLRAAYEIEDKKDRLLTYYYGEGGSLLSDTVKDAFLREHYLCFKQILIRNYYFIYATDKNGDDVYYDENGKIAYDTVGGTKSGERDADGNEIYVLPDGKIAYDKTNGKRKHELTEAGEYKTKNYTAAEMEERQKLVEKIVSSISDGDFATFEAQMKVYLEDPEFADGLGLYFFRTDKTYRYDYIGTIVGALADAKVGDVRVASTDYGYHILMKYDLPSGAYDEETYKDFFGDFYTDLTSSLFSSVLAPYKERVVTDGARIADLEIYELGSDYYY